MKRISIIIPTLNEEENIVPLLNYLAGLDPQIELIVVDGYSIDKTAEQASDVAKVLQCERGRGRQMNAGAAVASGEILWFLHADCFPHRDSAKTIRQALEDHKIIGGAFEYNLDHPGIFFRLTECISNRKNRLLKLFFGDMGIFVRRETFWKVGGFKDIPLMEDMDFCNRLKEQGEVIILPLRIKTSARRWREEGIIKNMVRNWILQIAWSCGASAEKLARYYHFGNNEIIKNRPYS